jgi:N-acetylneuraminic acid mutarotase
VFSTVSAAELFEDSWNAKTPMAQTRAKFGVAAVAGEIYAIGGSCQVEVPSYDQFPLFVTNYLGTNERYDPKTDTWTTLASMPTPRDNFAIATYQNKIYCIGGVTGKSGMYNNLGINEVYDVATDSWCIKTSSMLLSEQRVQAHVVNGKIFVVTGTGEEYKFGELYMYDPEMDVWTEKASIPIALTTNDYYLISTVIDDKLLVVSVINPDRSDGLGQMKVMVYDPKIDVWSEGKAGPKIKACSGPYAVGTTTGAYAHKKAYFLGYDRPWQPILWIYDPVNDAWTTSVKAVESYDGGIAVVDDVLYVIRGTDMTQYVPIGYSPISNPSEMLPTFEPDIFDSSLTYLIVIISFVLVGTIYAGLFFYSRKKNR